MFNKKKDQLQREKDTLEFINILNDTFETGISLQYRNQLAMYLKEHRIVTIGDRVTVGEIITLLINTITGKQLGKIILDMKNISAGKYILVESKGK